MSAFTDLAIWREYVHHLAVERQRRPSTIAVYANTLNRWQRFLGHRPWQDATTRDLGRFLAQPVGQGMARRGQPLSDAARRHYTAALKSFYRWAAERGHLERDPMAAVVLGRTPTPMPRDLPLTDIRSLLVWVRGDDRAEVATWLCSEAGLRVGEVARLKTEDVVLRGPRPHLRIHDSKYGRSRVVPLTPALREVLGGYLAQRPAVGPLLERRHPADGRPMTPGTVSDTIRGVMRAAGIRGRPHDLRHSFATRLLAAGRGQNLMAVSRLLGHANSALTETVYGAGYTGPIDETVLLLGDPREAIHANRD